MNKHELRVKGLEASYCGLAAINWFEKLSERHDELMDKFELARDSGNLNKVIEISAEITVISQLLEKLVEIEELCKTESDDVLTKLELF